MFALRSYRRALSVFGAFLAAVMLSSVSWAQLSANQIPQPPIAPLTPLPSALYYFYFTCALAILSFGFLVWEAWRTRSAFPLAFIVAGMITVFVEPIYDGNTHVWFARPDVIMNISYNIAYPWYAMAGMSVMGGPIYWMCRAFGRGVSVRALWGYFALWFGWQVMMEVGGPLTNSYIYYGAQPFRFLGFPLWLALCLAFGFPVKGYVIHKLTQVMQGLRLWLMTVVMIPVVLFGSFLITWPMWVTLNGGRGALETNLAGLLCFVLAISAYHALTLIYARERDLRLAMPLPERQEL